MLSLTAILLGAAGAVLVFIARLRLTALLLMMLAFACWIAVLGLERAVPATLTQLSAIGMCAAFVRALHTARRA